MQLFSLRNIKQSINFIKVKSYLRRITPLRLEFSVSFDTKLKIKADSMIMKADSMIMKADSMIMKADSMIIKADSMIMKADSMIMKV